MVPGLVMNANWKPVRIDTGPLPIEKAIVFAGSDEPITLLMASYSDPGPVAFVVVTVKVAALRPAAVKATARASRSERMDELSFGHAMRRVLIVTAIFAAACASTVPRNSIDLSRAEVVDLTRDSRFGRAGRIANPESRIARTAASKRGRSCCCASSDCDGRERAGAGEHCKPRPPAAAMRVRHRPADEDRRRVGRTAAGRGVAAVV